jgi:hypothetical protein
MHPMYVFPLWYLTVVDRMLALWSPVHPIGALGVIVYASSAMKMIVEDQRCLFKKGRVASIGAFGAMRPDARVASDATDWSVRWCRVKPHLKYNGSIL